METDGDSRRCEKDVPPPPASYTSPRSRSWSFFAGDPCMTGSQAKDWIALHAREREE